jgi:UDP-3-O-[3-hydroxymyristoyl] glucosamine N-acyltransferase
MKITPLQIEEFVSKNEGISVLGNKNIIIERVVSLNNIGPGCISWARPGTLPVNDLDKQKDFALVCDVQFYASLKKSSGSGYYIICKNPKLIFSKLVEHFFSETKKTGIHPTAFVEQSAFVGKETFIGPFSYVGNCRIGNNVTIHGHCHIYDGVTIGDHVTIHAGTVIGSDGFGYSRDEQNAAIKFPHLGGVIIEDGVDIGANTCIDRGALGDTIIKKGAKIDNLVHIAHNAVIEENAFIIANAMIGGSTTVGKNTWIAPSVSILQQRSIGANSIIGMGSVVLTDIPPAEVWAGVPARKLKDNNSGSNE